MDKEVRNILIVGGTAAFLLWIFRPVKSGFLSMTKYPKPQTAAEIDNERENAVTSLTAYRAAMAAGENQKVLKELEGEIKKDYALTVKVSKGKIAIKSPSGKTVAYEAEK